MIPSSTVILSQFSVQNQGLWNSCLSLYQDTVGSSQCSGSLSGTHASLPGMLCDSRFLAVLLATLSQFFFSPYFLHFWLYILINSRLVSLGQTSSLSSCLVANVEFLMFSAAHCNEWRDRPFPRSCKSGSWCLSLPLVPTHKQTLCNLFQVKYPA